jgi:hypothetical protein
MNSINKKFEKFIISEAKKASKEKNIKLHLKEDKQKLHECGCGCDSCEKKEDDFIKIEFEPANSQEFSDNFDKEVIKESKEAKKMSKEMIRMKELLSFNNPLLKI